MVKYHKLRTQLSYYEVSLLWLKLLKKFHKRPVWWVLSVLMSQYKFTSLSHAVSKGTKNCFVPQLEFVGSIAWLTKQVNVMVYQAHRAFRDQNMAFSTIEEFKNICLTTCTFVWRGLLRSTCVCHYLWKEWLFRLHAFIFLCRTNPRVKYPQNSIFFLILKECYTDMKWTRIF